MCLTHKRKDILTGEFVLKYYFLIQIGFCRPRFSSREEVKNVLGMLGESTSSLDSLMKDVDLDNDGLFLLCNKISFLICYSFLLGRLDLNDFKALMRSSGHIPVRRKD